MRTAVLISGGVDSAVVVHKLKEEGHDLTLFYIRIGMDNGEGDCSAEEDIEMCTAIAHRYGLPLEVVSLHQEYWDNVMEYALRTVRSGLTPNPDMMCNKMIKFGYFEQRWGKDFDITATGHYATTTVVDGRKYLATAVDPVKDQTDFLAQIYDWQLKKALFPIGHYQKGEVREIAEREHLINAKRKDSQGICFLGKINYNDYIRKFLGEQPGEVLELETGKLIGKHRGLWFHTIGQRHGLGFGGGPWYVVKKDVANNVLYVSKGFEPRTAYKKDFPIHDFHFLTLDPWGEPGTSARVRFKIRHTPEYHTAVLERTGKGEFIVHADELIQGVAPGQFCVVYDEEHHRCYGSGEITV